MNARYVLSPDAQSDLDEIWDYTAEQWSADQADRYVLDLIGAIEAAAGAKADLATTFGRDISNSRRRRT